MKPTVINRIEDEAEVASCDGGGGVLGHPVVYLTFGDRDHVDCYYCSRRFAKSPYFKHETEPAA